MPSPLLVRVATPARVDLTATLAGLRVGATDPCWRREADGSWWWGTRTPAGDVAAHLRADDGAVHVEAWGPGAPWVEAVAPRLVGGADGGWPDPPLVATEAVALVPGFRLAGTSRVVDAAVAGVCRRGVPAFEAARSWALMIEAMGDDAPGPTEVRLPPSPRRLAACEPYDLHVLGLEQGRADEVRRIASHAPRLEAQAGEPDAAVLDRLAGVAGVGADAIQHAAGVALGHPDAVPVLDVHDTATVVRVLRRAGGDPALDLAGLLEGYRPHRGRLVRLVLLAAATA